MEDLRGKLALMAYALVVSTGTLNRGFLDWIEPILRSYDTDVDTAQIIFSIGQMRQLTDEQLTSIPSKPETAPGLKPLLSPLLVAQIGSLSMFPLDFQRRVLQIWSRLQLLNKEIDLGWFMHTKTFDSGLTDRNWDRLVANIRVSHFTIINLCRDVINSIDKLGER